MTTATKNLALKKASKLPKAKPAEVSWSKPKMILLDSIEFDQQYQSRSDIPSTAEYEELLTANTGWPFSEPVKLALIKDKAYVIAGFTRCAAALKAGRAEVLAIQAPMTRDKALELSLGENDGHGFRRTNADKAKAVRTALGKWPHKSANSIAKICKVSHTYVSNVVAKLKEKELEPHELEPAPEQVLLEPSKPKEPKPKEPEVDPFDQIPDYVEHETELPTDTPPPIVGSPPPGSVNLTAGMRQKAKAIVGQLVRALDELNKGEQCKEALQHILKEIG